MTKTHIQTFLFLLTLIISLVTPLASADTLDNLLKKVLDEREFESKEFKEREQKFKTQRDKQKILLNQAVKELKKEESLSQRLTTEFEKNEKELAILENELNITVGVLGELFGVVKQVAGDFRGQTLNSLVSAEIPGREKFASTLSARKKLPTTEELRQLWFEMQREMTEQGKVTQFTAEVISKKGKKSQKQVTRIGAFNLVSEGEYLIYQGELGQIKALAEQPERKFTRYIRKVEKAKPNTHPAFALDPSRGSLLSILIQKPSMLERIPQGGLIGFLIILTLLIGLGIAVERIIIITKEEKKIKAQLNASQYSEDNPIGQILNLYEKNKQWDMETLEMKLNETIIPYLLTIEKRIGLIKLLAAIAPLMGLLGTVTGMILTFQSITLFGSGDPKLMAGGISQALVTTMLGLSCAIPLLLIHNFISARAQKITHILEEQTAGLLAKKILDNNR